MLWTLTHNLTTVSFDLVGVKWLIVQFCLASAGHTNARILHFKFSFKRPCEVWNCLNAMKLL